MKKKNVIIKSVIIAVLIGLMVLSFAACSEKPSGSGGASTEASDVSKNEDPNGSDVTGGEGSGPSEESPDGTAASSEEGANASGQTPAGSDAEHSAGKFTAYLSYADPAAMEQGEGSQLIRNIEVKISTDGNDIESRVKGIINALSDIRSSDQYTAVSKDISVDEVDDVDQTIVIRLSYKGDRYFQTNDLRCLVYQITDSVLHSLQKEGLDFRNVKFETKSEFLLNEEFDITDGCFDLDDCDGFAGV